MKSSSRRRLERERKSKMQEFATEEPTIVDNSLYEVTFRWKN